MTTCSHRWLLGYCEHCGTPAHPAASLPMVEYRLPVRPEVAAAAEARTVAQLGLHGLSRAEITSRGLFDLAKALRAVYEQLHRTGPATANAKELLHCLVFAHHLAQMAMAAYAAQEAARELHLACPVTAAMTEQVLALLREQLEFAERWGRWRLQELGVEVEL